MAEAIVKLQQKYQSGDEPFVIDISRESLATIAGTATESLIRTLSDFKSEKMIDIQNGAIKVLDPKKLASLLN